MKRLTLIALCSLFAISAQAQEVRFSTNGVPAQEPDIDNPIYYLYGNQGAYRLNIRLTDGDGGEPKDMSDITTFRATVHDLTDGRLVQTKTQDVTGDNIDASIGQVRFVFDFLQDRGIDPDYEIKAVAVASDTNQNYTIHWGYLSVTSAPASSGSTVSLSVDLESFSAQTGTFDRIIVDDLDVSGAINAVDTSKVALAGSTMSGALTNSVGFYGDGAGLTNLTFVEANYSAGDVLPAVDGGAITNLPSVAADGAGAYLIYSNQMILATNGASGAENTFEHRFLVIAGGESNTGQYQSAYGVIAGGQGNTLDASAFNTISGGQNNEIDNNSASHSTVGGGQGNKMTSSGDWNTIGGGQNNTLSASGTGANTIAGGSTHYIDTGIYGFIGGGRQNYSRADYSAVVGGYLMITSADSDYSFAGAGYYCLNYAPYAGLVSGQRNYNGGAFAFMGSGNANTNLADHSSIITGQRNYIPASATNTSILNGSGVVADEPNAVFLQGVIRVGTNRLDLENGTYNGQSIL